MSEYRQGDILLVPIPDAPDGPEVARDNGRIILAYGETTGHAHAIDDTEARLIEIETGERFLEILRASDLVHEEHDTVTLPPGTYEVRRQREYRPEGIIRVAD